MKLHLLIYLLLPTLFLLSCKGDKSTSPEAEAITINGDKAPSFGAEFLEKPTEADNGNYMVVQIGQEVTLTYTGIEKDEITWTQDGMPLGDGTSLNTTHTWTEPGLKEITATRSDGENVIVYVMVKGDEIPPNEPDSDGDGISDEVDDCKDQWGLKEFNGCPDTDGDGVSDKDDKCPNTPGIKSRKGCPKDNVTNEIDSDGDGVTDRNDKCPNEKGTKENRGCQSAPDSDGDGVPDKYDKCPNEKGMTKHNGCPDTKDTDGDGINDNEDDCPKVKGVKELKGCPPPTDRDDDGIPDRDDKCPTEKGTKANNGCPDEDFEKTGRAGFTKSSCSGENKVSGASSIMITPKRNMELSYVKVVSENTSLANVTINSNDGQKAVQMRKRQLNPGISEINFEHLGYVMKIGTTYTITISAADDAFSLSDLSGCNSGSGSNDAVDVSYGGAGKVFFNFVYKY